jgi:hypothetical protein
MSIIFFMNNNTVIELIFPYSLAEGGGNCVPMYSNKCSEIGTSPAVVPYHWRRLVTPVPAKKNECIQSHLPWTGGSCCCPRRQQHAEYPSYLRVDTSSQKQKGPVLRIRIRRIHMFWGLSDPNHQPKIVRKTLISTGFRLLYDFLSVKNYVNVPSKSNK